MLQSATATATAGNSFFGLAIGFTVTAMAVAIGPLSGGALNPAVGLLHFAASVRGQYGSWAATIFVYCLACPAGGALAALCYRVINAPEFEPQRPTEKTSLIEPLSAA